MPPLKTQLAESHARVPALNMKRKSSAETEKSKRPFGFQYPGTKNKPSNASGIENRPHFRAVRRHFRPMAQRSRQAKASFETSHSKYTYESERSTGQQFIGHVSPEEQAGVSSSVFSDHRTVRGWIFGENVMGEVCKGIS
ncbi:MAG: hypothetical protein NTV93_06615 [Verrucomicrobia bacterium]|nr:hypothetical protein [Verrucomicrobiota bacterium]